MPDPISWTNALPYLLSGLFFGYLLGSLPFGLILARLTGAGDIRKIGSGNIGATNVLRTGRKGLAAATLALDMAKGAVPVLIAGNWGPDVQICAGFGAFVGHLFSVWLRFKGGKGVATALGVWLAIAFPVGIAACAAWLVFGLVTRYSSIASMASMGLTPVFAWLFMRDLQLVEFAVAIAALVIFRHHGNIGRLLRGEESKIRLRKS
jgi:glycerol-3-phosphate acyltransferase PlsY